jgi:RES domain-containing protein
VRVWRLALGLHAGLDGEGARLYGGRWNSVGVPVVYAATHLSLALLEQLVHVNPERLPAALRAFAIDLPDEVVPERADLTEAGDAKACRRYGDAWLAARHSAALVVPSVVIPARLEPGQIATDERNVLLNPRHASAAAWRVVETAFRVDARLKRAGSGSSPP